MPDLKIEVNDYRLARDYAPHVLAGNLFAFINPSSSAGGPDDPQAGLANFYGYQAAPVRRVLPLLPGPLALPGLRLSLDGPALKAGACLLPDKEIYRAGRDPVNLLLVAPEWAFGGVGARPERARLTLENNGAVLRTQDVVLQSGGLTLTSLENLPAGNYQVFWDEQAVAGYDGERPQVRFQVVEYTLAPLQATLLAHSLDAGRLACRLKVKRYQEPLNRPAEFELWSGNRRLDRCPARPATPGIYNLEFQAAADITERLEVRVTYLDALATLVIPGSRPEEQAGALVSGLGRVVQASLMPRPGAREIRGLYLYESARNNTPVSLDDPAPSNGKAVLNFAAAMQAVRLLALDLAGRVVEDREIGDVPAGHRIELAVPAPAGMLALGGWAGEAAWEGWAALLQPSQASLEISAPAVARPGQEVEVKITTSGPASVFLLARDSRLAGAGPYTELAAALKKGLAGLEKRPASFRRETLDRHPAFPSDHYVKRLMRMSSADFLAGGRADFELPASPRMMMAPTALGRPDMVVYSMAAENELYEGAPHAQAAAEVQAAPRLDFADVAFCGLVQTGPDGQGQVSFRLPQAITGYSLEAFALSPDGTDWAASRESLEVTQPLWAEFRLPAFIYETDSCPATLEVRCAGGRFRLGLFCDGQPVSFSLEGATGVSPGVFEGRQAGVRFEARPGRWRAELEDLRSGQQDRVEQEVGRLGRFKSLARRFQLLPEGQPLDRAAAGALQLRLLPSLDRPFMILCDATADYGHRCCEQTAAVLLAAVASLAAGGEPARLRDVIVAGIEREKRMFLPGRGFMMYPPEESGGRREPDNYWGWLAAEHLSSLSFLGDTLTESAGQQFPAELQAALAEAVQLGQAAAQAYKLPAVPARIECGRDAYRVAAAGGELLLQALQYARRQLQAAPEQSHDMVRTRQETAYCAAALLKGNSQADLSLALAAANRLAADLNDQGRLYSTVDSVALISLLAALREKGIGSAGGGRVALDGREMPYAEAVEAAQGGQVERIEVRQGAALVEITAEVVEDWQAFRPQVPVRVELAGQDGQALRLGASLELVVSIEQYEPGLLAQVALPPALSKLSGGGEIKRFEADFCGRTEVRVPLRATGYTLPAGERWAVMVRNMFKEEQAGSPGLLQLQVSPD